MTYPTPQELRDWADDARHAKPWAPVRRGTLRELADRLDDYEAAAQEHRRLVCVLDALMNGERAAQQASLCDLVSQVSAARTPMFARPAGMVRAYAAPLPRCTYCDGTGDVHGIDGEWRGACHCLAGALK